MFVNYSDKKVVKSTTVQLGSIFLAGPTPRSESIQSWRMNALDILAARHYDGIVYVPELEHDNRSFDYINQTEWEREALEAAKTIVFWIPRNVKDMPGFTTNVEFGFWIAKDKDKVLYGRPEGSEKNRYLDWLYYRETGRTPYAYLEDLLVSALNYA